MIDIMSVMLPLLPGTERPSAAEDFAPKGKTTKTP